MSNKCPKCKEETRNTNQYGLNLCVNKDCSLYLEDDVSMFKIKTNSKFKEADIIEVLDMLNYDVIYKTIRFIQNYKSTYVPSSVDDLRGYIKQRVYEAIDECKSNPSKIMVTESGLFRVEVDMTDEQPFLTVLFVPDSAYTLY